MFIQVKSLAGTNYIRASDVIAVSFTDKEKCNVIMAGGISLPCAEAASVVSARVETAMAAPHIGAAHPDTIEQER